MNDSTAGEYRKCKVGSQAQLGFPHHKMLQYMEFDFLSTKRILMLKDGIVEKRSNLLYYKRLCDT